MPMSTDIFIRHRVQASFISDLTPIVVLALCSTFFIVCVVCMVDPHLKTIKQLGCLESTPGMLTQ